jgi:hypothetical protein
MRKLIFLSLIFSILLITPIFALNLSDSYTVQPSTITPTIMPNISSSIVRIKQIMITTGATDQTVTIYKNVYTGLTPSVVATIDIPANDVRYWPNTVLDDEQNFDIPYFAVKTSTTTNPANVNVIYKSR